MDANINFSDCYKAISNFGSTTYQNICYGTTTVVQNGAVDKITIFVLMGLMVGCLAIFTYIIASFFRNHY